MRIFRGLRHAHLASSSALTIGSFDGVHRGHQAMLALLKNEAEHRGLVTTVLTFEPHPRDYFAALYQKPELAPARIATLRDKLTELARLQIEQVVILPFQPALAALSAPAFIEQVVCQGLRAKYVLVGDDFRFGAGRKGDYSMLDAAGLARGFDVARMQSYEVHGMRVSSSEVRLALSEGRLDDAASLLGRPYTISGRVVHGRKLGRLLGATAHRPMGFSTLNLRFRHWKPAASGIFVVRVRGLTEPPLLGVANMGVRPSLDPRDVNAGRVLLETHCLDWPPELSQDAAYGRLIQVELLHKLHEERRYASLEALQEGINQDLADAQAYLKRLA